MKCAKGYEIRPLKSAAGWYLGTLDADGFPNCRLTSNYAETEEDAKLLFMDRQMACENEFCNGGCGCIVHFHERRHYVSAMRGFHEMTDEERERVKEAFRNGPTHAVVSRDDSSTLERVMKEVRFPRG